MGDIGKPRRHQIEVEPVEPFGEPARQPVREEPAKQEPAKEPAHT